MKTSSAKAKGRRCAEEVKELLSKRFPIMAEDIHVTSSGVTGPDLQIFGPGRFIFPFAVECKNQEKLNIWDAYEQAVGHLDNPQFSDCRPIVFFKRNRSKLMVCISAEDFLCLTTTSK